MLKMAIVKQKIIILQFFCHLDLYKKAKIFYKTANFVTIYLLRFALRLGQNI